MAPHPGGSHHSLIPLGFFNLFTHYTLVYLYPPSISSTQPHILTEGNRITSYFTLRPVLLNLSTVLHVQSSYHVHQQMHTYKQIRKRDETQV
ncbi:hypothetical protein AAZX31_18G129700 [Glycine max]